MATDFNKIMKDNRTIEATRKGYVGLSGKFGIIVKNMGYEIYNHNGGGADGVSFESFPAPWASIYELMEGPGDPHTAKNNDDFMQSLPTTHGLMGPPGYDSNPVGPGWASKAPGESAHPNVIGYGFDGLSRGMHIEIQYMSESSEILVTYQGRKVYQEMAGELASFVPNSEWEDKIETLYEVASKINKKKRKEKSIQDKIDTEADKISLLEQLKEIWGDS